MYVDKEKYDTQTKIRIGNKKLKSSAYRYNGFNSFVLDTEEGFIWSDFVCQRVLKGKYSTDDIPIYCFTFEYKGKRIEEENVSEIRVFLPRDRFSLGTYDHYGEYDYQYKCPPQYAILEESDVDELYIVVHKVLVHPETKEKEYHVDIYRSLDKIIHLEDLSDRRTPESFIWYSFDCFRFSRLVDDDSKFNFTHKKTQRCIYDHGQIIPEDEYDCSLADWEKVLPNNQFSFKKIYSEKNDIDYSSADLKWDSSDPVIWHCVLGHEWEEPICSYTKVKWPDNGQLCYCPKCLEYFPGLAHEELRKQRTFYSYLKSNYDQKEINDLGLIRDDIQNKYDEVCDLIKQGIWIEEPENEQEFEYRFIFPNGKQGDIAKYIAEEYGNLSFISNLTYKGVVSSKHLKLLSIVSDKLSEKQLPLLMPDPGDLSFENNILFNYMILPKEKRDEISEDKDLLIYKLKHDLTLRLNFYRSIYMTAFGKPENYKEIDKLLSPYYTEKYDIEKEIYNKIVADGRASRKWVCEQQLYALVKEKFDDAEFQYRTRWLGQQSLDVFVPSINVGIEYQGVQHYEPVSLFGGEKALEERRILDDRKRTLCKKNGVTLLEWKYTEPVTPENVKSFLSEWI